MLYTEDGNGETTTFNLIGTEDNILFTARPAEEEETSFYSYTKDLRESTINLVGSDGSSVRSYSYDDFGETKVMGSGDFCNEVCYGAGIYDDTTGLYYLNARYYAPDTGNFLTQDTYRGSRSRTETLNLYGYCAGNPINYTDPSGHWIWGIIGAASGAYDGYKYAKKKKYKGWRKAAAIAGGAALGAVNPFKVFKAARTGYRAYKACKYARKARSYVRKGKALKKIKLKARHTKITKYFTDSRYKNAEVAQDRLSLPEKPDFILEFEITNNPIIKGGNRVEPNYGGKGGGREYFTDDIVEIKIINYQKMVPGGR